MAVAVGVDGGGGDGPGGGGGGLCSVRRHVKVEAHHGHHAHDQDEVRRLVRVEDARRLRGELGAASVGAEHVAAAPRPDLGIVQRHPLLDLARVARTEELQDAVRTVAARRTCE